jgi:hypothetical protein
VGYLVAAGEPIARTCTIVLVASVHSMSSAAVDPSCTCSMRMQ